MDPSSRGLRPLYSRPPVRLSALLPVTQIGVPRAARTKPGVIEARRALPRSRNARARRAAHDAVVRREAELSTGIGRGVAVPHGRTPAVTRHLCAFGVAAAPVDFEAIDGQPCRLFFLCVSAEKDSLEHVRVLSQVARVLNNQTSREALERAAAPEDVRRVFQEDESREGL